MKNFMSKNTVAFLSIFVAFLFVIGSWGCSNSKSATAEEFINQLESTDETVTKKARENLAAMGIDAVPSVIKALDHENTQVKIHACWVLTLIGPQAKEQSIPALERLLSDKDSWVRMAADGAIAQIKHDSKQ